MVEAEFFVVVVAVAVAVAVVEAEIAVLAAVETESAAAGEEMNLEILHELVIPLDTWKWDEE